MKTILISLKRIAGPLITRILMIPILLTINPVESGNIAYAESIVLECGGWAIVEDYCSEVSSEWAQEANHKVSLFKTTFTSNTTLGLFQQILAARSDMVDVILIDVIWPGILKKHLIDLKQYIPQSNIDLHFKPLIENNTDIKGRLLAIPFYTDIGVLFYRKDMLEKHGRSVPETWEELVSTAKYILSREKKNNPKLVGFVWQGRTYEGLTCNALEWIDSYRGGTIIDGTTGEITLNNPRAVKALKMAASWIGTISPKEVLDMVELTSSDIFNTGNAIFMRTWSSAMNELNLPESPVKGKFDMVALPKGGTDGKHTGTVGGWGFSVTKYSNNPKLAANIIQHLTSRENMFDFPARITANPTVANLYEDPAFLKKYPYMAKLYDSFSNAVARPSKLTGKRYAKVSTKFWKAVHSVLRGENTAEAALAKLEKDLIRIKGKRGW